MKAKKANVNVFRLDLTSLSNRAALATGDPMRCNGCGVMLNNYSRVQYDQTKAQVQQLVAGGKNDALLELAPPIHNKFLEAIATGEKKNCLLCFFDFLL